MQPVQGSSYQCHATALPDGFSGSTSQQHQQSQQSHQSTHQASQQQQQQSVEQHQNMQQNIGQPATQQWACPRGSTAFCSAGICVCVNGQLVYDSRCAIQLPTSSFPSATKATYAYPGQSCTQPGVLCLGGSRCVQSVCLCDSGYVTQSGVCTTPMFVNTHQPNVPQTPPPTQPQPVGVTMQPFPSGVVPAHPGEICDTRCDYSGTCGRICSGGAICANGVCTCPHGTFAINGQCVPFALPQTSLQSQNDSSQAGSNSNLNGAIPSKKTSRPSEACDAQTPCRGGASCVLGICQCPPGYTPSSDKESCVNGLFLSQNPLSMMESAPTLVAHLSAQTLYSPPQPNYNTQLSQFQNYQPSYYSRRRAESNPLLPSLLSQSSMPIASRLSFNDNDNLPVAPAEREKTLSARNSAWLWRQRKSKNDGNEKEKEAPHYKNVAPLALARLGATRLGRKCVYNAECVHGARCQFGVCACPPHTVGTSTGICVPEGLLTGSSVEEEMTLSRRLSRSDQHRSKKSDTPRPLTENWLIRVQQDALQNKKTKYVNNDDKNNKAVTANSSQQQNPSKNDKIRPGSPCNNNKENNNKSCDNGASCRLLKSLNKAAFYCVCPHTAVVSTAGNCTSLLLSDTKKRFPGAACNSSIKCDNSAECLDGYCVCSAKNHAAAMTNNEPSCTLFV